MRATRAMSGDLSSLSERRTIINPEAPWEGIEHFPPPPTEPDWLDDARAGFAGLAIGVLAFILAALVWLGYALFVPHAALARDDGRYADSPLKTWFDNLASGKGLCCSFADGFSVQDVDWDTQDGRYRVRLHGEWIAVPDNAVVTEPNKFGAAVVWPYTDVEGKTQIRCFLPRAGT